MSEHAVLWSMTFTFPVADYDGKTSDHLGQI